MLVPAAASAAHASLRGSPPLAARAAARAGSPGSAASSSSEPLSPMAPSDADAALSRCGTALFELSGGEPVPLRMCSFNIHGWRDTFHADNFERLAACVREIAPDVLVLQEVLHPYCPPADSAAAAEYFEAVKAGKGNGFQLPSDGRAPYLERLAKAAGLPHVAFGRAVDDGYFGAVPYGNAVLSRFPVLSEKHTVVVPDAKHQAGRRIEAEDRCVSLVTLDLARRGGAPLTLAATHLDQLSDELRLEQVQALTAFCADAGPHVLVGDFNVFQKADCSPAQWAAILADADSKGWPHPPERSAALDALLGASKYRDCFYAADNHREGHADPALALTRGAKDAEFPGATCWVTKPLLRIDYALLSPELAAANVAVAQYQRVLDEASDHFPVVVDLKLPPAGAAALAGGAVRRSAAREGSPMVEAGQSSDDDMAVEVN